MKILIVDDEPELVKAIEIRLKQANYEVLTAYDGLEGLEKAKKEKPDLILLDILMPNIDGYQTLSKLKEDGITKDVPVIMLTSKSQVNDVAEAIGLGAVDYIVKPFEPRILLEKIKKELS